MNGPQFPYCRKCTLKKHEGVPAISVEHLYANYPHKKDALCDISFTVEAGTRMALLGHNGAGKSSLLKAMVGLMPIAAGRVKIMGHPAAAGKHAVTYLPQRSEIDWVFPITLYKLVLMGSYIYLGWFRKPTQAHRKKTREALELLGLEELIDRQIGELSVGEQQRALLARALVHDAELFLLDEPLNGVDVETQAIINRVFDQLKEVGKTLVIATHDREHLAEKFDNALVLDRGRLLERLQGPFRGKEGVV